MALDDRNFTVRLARDTQDITAAQRLRYEVFVRELGGSGTLVDHDAGLERDRFDPFFDHLILADESRGGEVVGVYRLLRDDQACVAGQFYSEDSLTIYTRFLKPYSYWSPSLASLICLSGLIALRFSVQDYVNYTTMRIY